MKHMEHHELIVIGGGPAGLAATVSAAEKGVECLLIDEQATPGGQIYRSIEHISQQRAALLGADYQYGRELVEQFRASGAAYLSGTLLWNLSAGFEVGILRDGQASMLSADRIIIASGAMERPVPFPGWVLPGVMTAGAGQILLKSSGLVPAQGLVLAGSGPLLLLLAWQYLQAGVTIHGILEVTEPGSFRRALPHLPRALRGYHYLLKGLRYQLALKKAGVRFYKGVSGLRAVGDDALEAVVFTHGGREQRIASPLLLTHFGVIPDSYLSRCSGCEHVWDETQLCWRPLTDEWGNSSIDGIAIAGDGTVIGGAVTARHAGRIAGFESARALGRISLQQRDEAAKQDQRGRTADLQVRPFLDTMFRPPTALLHQQEDETLICRCEEITAATLRSAIQAGHTDSNQLKFQTRCGMGACQGRQCDNAVSQLLAHEQGVDTMLAGGYRIRPPIRPLTIGQLAALEGVTAK